MAFPVAFIVIVFGLACEHEVQGVTDEEFQQLSTRMLAMESEISLLKERDFAHEAQIRQQTHLIADLRHTNAKQDTRIKALETMLSAAYRTETSVEGKEILKGAPEVPTNVVYTTNRNPDMNRALQHHKPVAPTEHKQHARFIPADGVAFTAVKSAFQSGIGTKQNIVFDSVFLNVGNGYHEQHGLFIAPQAGIYLFTATLLSSHSTGGIELHAALVKNGNPIVRIYAHGDSGRHDQGGQTIIADVQVGDEFWVENIDYTNSAVYGDAYSSFSGIMILPL